jgi:hypothetical protein
MKNLMFLLALAASLGGCGKSAAPADPAHAVAEQTCKATIEARATNSKSVAYLNHDAPVSKNAKGQLVVTLKVSAKNEIGMASTMLATCTVSADGKTLADIAVKDTR